MKFKHVLLFAVFAAIIFLQSGCAKDDGPPGLNSTNALMSVNAVINGSTYNMIYGDNSTNGVFPVMGRDTITTTDTTEYFPYCLLSDTSATGGGNTLGLTFGAIIEQGNHAAEPDSGLLYNYFTQAGFSFNQNGTRDVEMNFYKKTGNTYQLQYHTKGVTQNGAGFRVSRVNQTYFNGAYVIQISGTFTCTVANSSGAKFQVTNGSFKLYVN